MLAVVQPYSASPDVAHRPRSTLSSATASSSRSASSNLASNQPPSLQRHQTAPPASSQVHFAPRRAPTPPPKAPTPTPPPLAPAADSTFDIHSYPPADLLKLLALLLTHIATTNDHLSPSSTSSSSGSSHSHLPLPDPIDAPPIWHSLTTASRGAISTSAATLTFHARNIPTITLEAYLLRILKYCPTTNHVFLSLLVYFDRMSKLSEDAVGRAFIIDSYNIHRLVIAGVTVASKFFSDVFYTNSRYAKVGGLPLPELNQLELQFLLLNDFRLVISSTEMQHYAEQLILFSKNTANTATPPHLHFAPPLLNGHSNSHSDPSPNPSPILPSPASSTSSTRTITMANYKDPLQSAESKSQPGSQQPSPMPSFLGFSSSSMGGAFSGTPGPTRPFDALGEIPPPVENPTHQPSFYSHSYPQPPMMGRSQNYQQRQEAQSHQRYQEPMEDHDPDSDPEDADTCTDAGSETDEEPTIRAPPTVGGGSVWGDDDDRMGSP